MDGDESGRGSLFGSDNHRLTSESRVRNPRGLVCSRREELSPVREADQTVSILRAPSSVLLVDDLPPNSQVPLQEREPAGESIEHKRIPGLEDRPLVVSKVLDSSSHEPMVRREGN